MDLQNPNRTVFPYTDYFNMGFLLNPNIARVLFIGGGGLTGPKQFLRDYPNVTVDVAEIDPEVISVAEEYFAVNASSPRLHIYSDDGRIFLQRTNKRYDLIVLDAYSRSYVPFHLMTTEFFKLVSAHLISNGLVISNLISGTAAGNDQLLTAETNTMHTVLPNVYTFAVQGPSDTEAQNVKILATSSTPHLTASDFEHLASTSLLGKTPALKDHVTNYFTPPQTSPPILTDDYAPVENLFSGQPLTTDQQPPLTQGEALRITVGLLIVATVAALLIKKRFL
jgi:spermidine synthase